MITYEQWKSLYVECPNGGHQYNDFWFCPKYDMGEYGDLKRNTACWSCPKYSHWAKDEYGREYVYLKNYDEYLPPDICFMTKKEAEKELERRKQNEMES